MDWKLPWLGGCRCGRVRVRVTAAPLLTFACHCTGCQRMSASAYSLTIALPATALEVIEGEAVIGGIHGATRHYHCDHCKAWLFTRPEGNDGMVNLRAPVLDDHRWFVPWVEVFTGEGHQWARTGAKHSYADNPADVPWEPLLEEYARDAQRPA
jgi:hypothetical protein